MNAPFLRFFNGSHVDGYVFQSWEGGTFQIDVNNNSWSGNLTQQFDGGQFSFLGSNTSFAASLGYNRDGSSVQFSFDNNGYSGTFRHDWTNGNYLFGRMSYQNNGTYDFYIGGQINW